MRGHDDGGDRRAERGFRYAVTGRDGRVARQNDSVYNLCICVFEYIVVLQLHQILSCTICRLHVRRPIGDALRTPQMKATRMPPGVGGSVFFVRFETFVCRLTERSYMYKDSRSTRNYMR